ncbi:hypothetical protein ACLBWZ_07995 [Brucellaceae bacterium C25G]
MTVQVNPFVSKRALIFLASTAITLLHPQFNPAFAQSANTGAVIGTKYTFDITAQPLNDALKAFSKMTGWQVGYQSAVGRGLSSRSVKGQYTAIEALELMLSRTNIQIETSANGTITLKEDTASTSSREDGVTELDVIVVSGNQTGVQLGTDSEADTGTTVISGGQLAARTAGNDANSVLRNLPNVQYQKDSSTSAGITDQSVIDTRPLEVSISGARVYENNFILNGVGINDITGSQESATVTLSDGLTPPSEGTMFGLHSQTIYVPSDFLAETKIIDSNASAQYGGFQGGVVAYTLRDASRDRLRGSVTTDYTTSDWAGYHIATTTGLNPNNVEKQEYLKRRTSVSLSGPLSDNIAILGQYSIQTAETHKDKWARYTDQRRVEEDSKNQFYRGQILADTDFGRFTLEGFYTRYSQYWENAGWRNMRMNTGKKALNVKLQNDYDLSDLSLGGVNITNASLSSKLVYGRSNSINQSNSNIGRVYKQSIRSGGTTKWESQTLSDWCQTDPAITGNTYCYDGGLGNKEQSQEQISWSEELKGDLGNGTVSLGTEYTYTEAHRRRPEEATYYTTYKTVGDVSGLTGFNCGNAEECNWEMFASGKAIYPEFDIRAHLNTFNAYAETEQTWNWFNLRAGLRVEYNDYMNNIDLAPRLVGTINPWADIYVTGGYNRYYNANSLAFAIRDKQPRSQSYTRTNTGADVSETWTRVGRDTYASNTTAELKTPYNDELTFGISGREPLFDGQWRLRYLQRFAKDQFASIKTNANTFELTNNATGEYQSATAEYSKDIEISRLPYLDNLTWNASITWSASRVSNDSYYADDFEDDHIWYNGKSYTKAGFNVVTGNLDIPLRLQTGISTAWLDNRFLVDVSGNYNFGYKGVRNTDVGIVVDEIIHDIWEDYDFSPTFTIDLTADVVLYKKNDTNFTLNVKVLNLLNEKGNAKSTTSNPWVIGRTIWVGAKTEF